MSYQTVATVNLWTVLLAATFFFVPNWLSHELVPESWSKVDSALKNLIWIRFFRDRKKETRFRLLFLSLGTFVAVLCYTVNEVLGGTAFLGAIGLVSLAAFLGLHFIVLYVKEKEIRDLSVYAPSN